MYTVSNHFDPIPKIRFDLRLFGNHQKRRDDILFLLNGGTRVYVVNWGDGTVSIIDTATNTVKATLPVGDSPSGVAVTPDGTKVYVANSNSHNVSVIDTATDKVAFKVDIGTNPFGVAVTPDGKKVYVANYYPDMMMPTQVSVIDIATNNVTNVKVGRPSYGVAVDPAGTKVYVTISHFVFVIDATKNIVIGTVNVGVDSKGVAVNLAGTKVYVTNEGENSVSVIDTPSKIVTSTVGGCPIAFGQFIGGSIK